MPPIWYEGKLKDLTSENYYYDEANPYTLDEYLGLNPAFETLNTPYSDVCLDEAFTGEKRRYRQAGVFFTILKLT